MRYVKNSFVLATLAVAVLLVSACAQGPGPQAKRQGMGKGMQGPGPRAGRQGMGMGMGMMGGQLGLSDAQKAQIKAIVAEYQPQMQRVRASNLPPDQKRTKFRALQTEMQRKINAVLTPEQRAKMKELREKRQGRVQTLEGCLKSLNLSARQQTAIRSIQKSTAAQIKAVKADTALVPAQKQAKIQSIRKDNREQIVKVLTPAQRKDLRTCLQSKK